MIPAPPSDQAPAAPMADQEQAGYLSCRSESIHYVLHRPLEAARAKILLASPLPDERTHSHLTWVRWARLLAEHGFLVMRFDYSGTGESSGAFERSTLSGWGAELGACAGWLRDEGGPAPMVLQGLRLGGLLSCEAFLDGYGDALLTWEPTASGKALLTDAARRQQAANMVQGIAEATPGPRELAERLERGESSEVNGYVWSPALWLDARAKQLERPREGDPRPLLHLRLRRTISAMTPAPSFAGSTGDGRHSEEAVSISWPPFWMVGNRLVHETEELFNRSLSFIEEAVASAPREVS